MNKASQLAGHHTGKPLMADLKQNRGKMREFISLCYTLRNNRRNNQKTGAQSDMKHSHDIRHTKAQDCRHKENYIGRQTRVTRETQLEPLKQWLSNKMGGDRQ